MNVRKGFTLVELVIFLVLLGIVLAIIFRVFYVGHNAFAAGSTQFQLQSDLRKAGDFITDELRYAEEIDIADSPDDDGYCYIFLEDSRIKYQYKDDIRDITDPIITNDNIFEIKRDSNGRNFLSINITGAMQGKSYNITTEVLLKNVSNLEPEAGKVIKYKKPVS